jgi:uncharacterized protein (DUF58 family)
VTHDLPLPALLAQARLLEIRARRLAHTFLAGLYPSAFRGPGLDFAAHRPYAPGDEIRHIDWNVTARTGLPHVKCYQDERRRIVCCALSDTPSMHFGSTWRTKAEAARELAAVLALAALAHGDRAGLLRFDEDAARLVPPGRGRNHALRLARSLVRPAAGPARAAPEPLLAALPRGSLIFLISDFLTPPDPRSLARLAHRHDLVCLWLFDPLERRLPPLGAVPLQPRGWLPTGPRRRRVNRRLADHARAVRALFRRFALDTAEIDAGRNYLDPLRRLMHARRRRLRR